MKKMIGVLGMILLIGAVAIPVMAHGPGWGRGGGNDNLTTEQQEQLEGLHEQFYNDTDQLRKDLRTKRDAMRKLFETGDVNPDDAKALQSEISNLQSQMAQKRINLMIEAHKIAPDAQGFGKGYKRGRGGPRFGGAGWRGGPGSCWN